MSATREPIPPGGTIGILGGGQLGRMIALAAAALGYRTAVLTPAADDPAAQVATRTIVSSYEDEAGLRRLAELSDAVTLEFENVPVAALSFIERQGRAGRQVHAFKVEGRDAHGEAQLARRSRTWRTEASSGSGSIVNPSSRHIFSIPVLRVMTEPKISSMPVARA